MPAPEPVTFPLHQLAPVWLGARAGLPERLALDPISVPVTVRGVNPEALRPRGVPMDQINSVSAHVFEGRLWRQVNPGPRSTLRDAVAILSGEVGSPDRPFRASVPMRFASQAHPGHVPIPPRALARAGMALHDVARDRAREAARRDLVHDGNRIYAAIDLPLLHLTYGTYAKFNWRDPAWAWDPMFPHDRPDVAMAHFASGGWAAEHVERNRATKQAIVDMLAEALHDVPSGDDNLRHLLLKGSFLALEGAETFSDWTKVPDADLTALKELCARAAIGAETPDTGRHVDLIERVATLTDRGGDRSKRHHRLRDQLTALASYCRDVARPQLAPGPVPVEDLGSLGALSP